MLFDVRINGQILQPISRAEVERRARIWLRAGALVEVREKSSVPFVPLAQFLAAPPAGGGATAAPTLSAAGHSYLVRVNGQIIGTLDRIELERRAIRWKQVGASVEVAENGSQIFQRLDSLLSNLPGVVPPQSTPSFSISGPYEVHINGHPMGRMERSEIERRSVHWGKAGVEIVDPATSASLSLASFLTLVAAHPAPVASAAAMAGPYTSGPVASPPALTSKTPPPGFPSPTRANTARVVWIALIAAATCAAVVIGIVLFKPRDPYEMASKYKNAQDYPNAAIWFRKAAEGGNANAQVNLALLYQNGQGVPRDATEAFNWAHKSADQGNAAGETLLGTMYENGEGVSRDEAAAADYYQKAAYQGYTWAESLLANMYLGGRGNLEQDYVLAYKWFLRAAAGGDETAKSALVMLSGLMNQDQVRQATELAQQD